MFEKSPWNCAKIFSAWNLDFCRRQSHPRHAQPKGRQNLEAKVKISVTKFNMAPFSNGILLGFDSGLNVFCAGRACHCLPLGSPPSKKASASRDLPRAASDCAVAGVRCDRARRARCAAVQTIFPRSRSLVPRACVRQSREVASRLPLPQNDWIR